MNNQLMSELVNECFSYQFYGFPTMTGFDFSDFPNTPELRSKFREYVIDRLFGDDIYNGETEYQNHLGLLDECLTTSFQKWETIKNNL